MGIHTLVFVPTPTIQLSTVPVVSNIMVQLTITFVVLVTLGLAVSPAIARVYKGGVDGCKNRCAKLGVSAEFCAVSCLKVVQYCEDPTLNVTEDNCEDKCVDDLAEAKMNHLIKLCPAVCKGGFSRCQ